MNTRVCSVFACLCGLAAFVPSAIPSGAQATEVKEKPAMYTYVANWQIPRAHWADMDAANSGEKAVLDKAVADGTIVGYGSDVNEVHTPDGETHDSWWSSMSMAGLMKVLDQLRADSETSPALESATKHWDMVLMSRYYNWKPGPYTGAYINVMIYQLKKDAPDDAVSTLSKSIVVPAMEKLLADGTIVEYEIDTEAIHTDAPGMFAIVFVAAQPEGIDTVRAAILGTEKDNPLIGPAFDSYVDYSLHRDELLKGNGTYK